jgi:hypothetical protein
MTEIELESQDGKNATNTTNKRQHISSPSDGARTEDSHSRKGDPKNEVGNPTVGKIEHKGSKSDTFVTPGVFKQRTKRPKTSQTTLISTGEIREQLKPIESKLVEIIRDRNLTCDTIANILSETGGQHRIDSIIKKYDQNGEQLYDIFNEIYSIVTEKTMKIRLKKLLAKIEHEMEAIIIIIIMIKI